MYNKTFKQMHFTRPVYLHIYQRFYKYCYYVFTVKPLKGEAYNHNHIFTVDLHQ